MKNFLICTVIFISIALASTAEARAYKKNTLISIKVDSVSYHEAVIDIEFYLADERSNALFMMSTEGGISRNLMANYLKHGFNKIKAVIQREKNKNDRITTKKAILSVYENLADPFWKAEIDFDINWPGPEFINEILGDSKIEFFDDSSIRYVDISRRVHDSEELYKDVLRSGVPIYKAKFSGIVVGPSRVKSITIKVGEDVEPSAAKSVISFLLKRNYKIVDIEVDNNKYYNDSIYILSGGTGKLSQSDITKLKQNNLSDNEYYALLGIKQPTADEFLKSKYDEAYSLLDMGGKDNFNRAKNILDEIISKYPDYTNAYVELARYRMKILGGTSESFDAAEKTLLIAKDIDPEHANTRVLLGYVYTNQGRYEEAKIEYKMADKIGTDNSWLYANWGLNEEKQSNTDEAINHYAKVMTRQRSFDRNDRVMKWTKNRIFPLLEKQERYEEADRYYAKYVKDFPSDSCMLLSQAENKLFNFGDYEAAIEQNILAAKKGCHKKSDSLAVAYYLKWYTRDNNNSTKDGAFRQAEAMAPDDARLFYYLAQSEITAPIINLLVKNGRDLSAEDSEGLTALLLAVYVEDRDVVMRLVSMGADINDLSDKIKVSPLGLAVLKQNVDMVEFLIDNEADTEVVLPNGMSMYKWAKDSGHTDISRLLGGKQSI